MGKVSTVEMMTQYSMSYYTVRIMRKNKDIELKNLNRIKLKLDLIDLL